VAEDLKKYTCDAMAGKEIHTSYAALKKARDQIKKCPLIFTTCIGAGLGLLRSESFDTVIIDEAFLSSKVVRKPFWLAIMSS
jgi:regulator of nonsense transcripts 1